jgi:hypothetical protein
MCGITMLASRVYSVYDAHLTIRPARNPIKPQRFVLRLFCALIGLLRQCSWQFRWRIA